MQREEMKAFYGKLRLNSGKAPKRGSRSAANIGCPFADTRSPVDVEAARNAGCPFHAHSKNEAEAITTISSAPSVGGTFYGSKLSADLLANIGGGDKLREGCTRFYARAFEDYTLAPFMTVEDDGAEMHGKRLADWIIEKMGGEGTPWADSGRTGMRQPTHYAAWNSPARDPSVRGEHFKLDDCIIWMRIHFWGLREVGLDKYPAFWKWYVGFIAHFVSVYERQAPAYAEEAADWSLDTLNIETYFQSEHRMLDVIGRGR